MQNFSKETRPADRSPTGADCLNHSDDKSAQFRRYRKVALAACFGTFIEWYDFLIFASLAVHFSALFFPADDPVAGLLYSLATFGIGMVVRPVGVVIFGSPSTRRPRSVVQ